MQVRKGYLAFRLSVSVLTIGDRKTEQALELLFQAVVTQVDFSLAHNTPANLFTPADGKCFQMFAAGQHRVIGLLKIEFETDGLSIERVDARQYLDERDLTGGRLIGV